MWAAFVSCDDFPNLGHEALDDEHKSIVRLMNELHDAILRKATVAEQRRLLHELESYVRVNCRSEEEMMLTDLYPARDQHRKAHDGLYRALYDYQKVLQLGQEAASLQGLRAMRDHFIRHISQDDTRVASWHRISSISSDSPD